MKNFKVIALAVAMVMLFAVPAMALDADFSGYYRVRGYYLDNQDLNDQVGSSHARMDMRLRLEAEFKVHDRLKLNTRWHGFDNTGDTDVVLVWGWRGCGSLEDSGYEVDEGAPA